jgi:4-amino-4-deoxy-L-arabinose transferase-like glycosyltransferase
VVSLPWGDVNEYRARIFSSLAALGTILVTFYLGMRAFSPAAGFLGATILGTSVLFLQYGRWAQTNMLSTFFATLSIFLFYRGYKNTEKRHISYIFMYISMGLGVLTMGPVNLVMPGLVIFGYLLVMKDIRHIGELKLVWGILIFLAITMPWYVVVSLKEGYAFDLLIKTNLARYVDTWTHAQPFYYYAIDLPWAFAPWFLFLPGAVHLALSKRSRQDREALNFLLVWAISLFLFFSIAQAKRPQYILGLYPALALLVGYLGDRAIRCRTTRYFQKAVIIPALIFMGVLAAATLALPIVVGIFFKSWLAAAFGAAVITGIFAALVWFARSKRQIRSLLFLPAAFILVLTIYSVHVLVPKMEYYKSPRSFCQEIVERLQKGGNWAMFQFYRAAYVYYTDSFCQVLQSKGELEAFLEQPDQALVVMKERNYHRLIDALKTNTYVIAKKQIGHRQMVLISNRNE